MSVEERLARLEQAFVTLTELAVRADERMDSYDRSFDELDTKIAALTDAQVRTEANVAKLVEAQEHIDAALAKLARAQERTDEALVKLAETQERTDAALAKLAQAQERTDSKLAETDARLNRLADIVERYISEGREGK